MPTKLRAWTTTQRGYGRQHQRTREELEPLVLAGGVLCWRCAEPIEPGESWHLGHDDHDRSRYRGPEHERCNLGATRYLAPLALEQPVERDGLNASDPRWDVPWLKGLRRVPKDATWPRLMTVPHPQATGSYGKEFAAWSQAREGVGLRWWQRLAAARMLEHDDDGRLVWDAVLLSMARQLGKSWLLRELCLWRIEQGVRFHEAQDVLHTGKDLAVVIEVQRLARIWAKPQGAYKVTEANGKEQIQYLPDLGGRWLVKAKGAPYGYTISCAVVDEAWNVETKYVEEGVVPTMVERASPQLLLVSTAHRLSTSLMLTRRDMALERLESGTGDLLIEWSAPRGAPVDDLDAWKLASPHWTAQRQQMISRRLEAMYAGETYDQSETDPVESFRGQWLNQWPQGLTILVGEELLPVGLWRQLTEDLPIADGPLYVAVEDDWGKGAAVAAATILPDGRIDVNGWLRPNWDAALEWVGLLSSAYEIKELLIGASMVSRVPLDTVPAPRPAGTSETRPGLAVFRDLAHNRMLVHDSMTQELDEAVVASRVKEGVAGLMLVSGGKATHLVKALVWAVGAAHKPAPVPAVY